MKLMVVAEYIGLIVLGAALVALGAIGFGAPINGCRVPRQRGLLSRLCLGERLTGLSDLRMRGGLSSFIFGEMWVTRRSL
jgi:hypothetical protein